MPRLVPLVFITVIAAACAGSDDPASLGLDGWIGASDRELVLSWGAPDGVYQLADGSRVLTWRSVRIEPMDRYATGDTPDSQQGAPVRYVCITNIEVGPLGDIRDYTIQGNGCPQQAQ